MRDGGSRQYRYVGPPELAAGASRAETGTYITTPTALRTFLNEAGSVGPFTFVVTTDCSLVLASRHSEHVHCARGGPVLSAGEVTFSQDGVGVEEITNQSTGFCPEPESWEAVAAALRACDVTAPADFTSEFEFRRCPNCGAISVVKSGWFVCAECDADLPLHWNF